MPPALERRRRLPRKVMMSITTVQETPVSPTERYLAAQEKYDAAYKVASLPIYEGDPRMHHIREWVEANPNRRVDWHDAEALGEFYAGHFGPKPEIWPGDAPEWNTAPVLVESVTASDGNPVVTFELGDHVAIENDREYAAAGVNRDDVLDLARDEIVEGRPHIQAYIGGNGTERINSAEHARAIALAFLLAADDLERVSGPAPAKVTPPPSFEPVVDPNESEVYIWSGRDIRRAVPGGEIRADEMYSIDNGFSFGFSLKRDGEAFTSGQFDSVNAEELRQVAIAALAAVVDHDSIPEVTR